MARFKAHSGLRLKTYRLVQLSLGANSATGSVPSLEVQINSVSATFGTSLGAGEKMEKKKKSWVYSNTFSQDM